MGEFNNAFYSAATIRIIKKSIENVTVWILKIRAFYKKTKKPRKILQGVNLPEVGIGQNSKEPCFYGISDDTENQSPQFCPQQNYFELILSYFDNLEPSEQERLLDALKERVKAAK